jgi:uncharacterized membrane protein YfcA
VPESLLDGLIAVVLLWSGIDVALRPIQARPQRRLRLGRGVALSTLIGALGGAVGVILGTMRMPALVRSVGMDIRRAAGTNLVVGFVLGVAGFATHAAEGGVDWSILAAGMAGAIPGGWLGAEPQGACPRTPFGSRSASCSWCGAGVRRAGARLADQATAAS